MLNLQYETFIQHLVLKLILNLTEKGHEIYF